MCLYVLTLKAFSLKWKHYMGDGVTCRNILGYYHNLVSLRYGKEYCVERRCMGKTFFFLFHWSLFQSCSYNCSLIGPCKIKKTNQCTVFAREAMAMQPAIAHQNRRGVWLCNQLHCHRNSDFFEGSNRGMHLIARPGTQYSFTYLREPKLQ